MLAIYLSLLLAFSTTSPTALPRDEGKMPSIDQLLYMTRLSDCESSGSSTIKVLDSNNKYSYGAYQFQMQTWLAQSEKYGLDYKEKDIYYFTKQARLAYLMLSDDGEGQWYTCGLKRLGKFPK